MPRFLVSTVRRRCPADEPSGYIYVVDPHKRQVLQRCAIVEPLYRELDNNPRGGMRGGKGISVLHIDPQTQHVLSTTQIATQGFLRGVMQLDLRRLLVGSRGELITFDLPTKVVEERLKITADPNEAVYDIKELPAHYVLPPVSFAEHFTQQTGLKDPGELYDKPQIIAKAG